MAEGYALLKDGERVSRPGTDAAPTIVNNFNIQGTVVTELELMRKTEQYLARTWASRSGK